MTYASASTEATTRDRALPVAMAQIVHATPSTVDRRRAALDVMGELRRLEKASGIENSRIALDIALLFFGVAGRSLSVKEMSAATGYSGPTIRLVLIRLISARMIEYGPQRGKTQFHRLSARGEAVMEEYVATLERLASRIPSAAAA